LPRRLPPRRHGLPRRRAPPQPRDAAARPLEVAPQQGHREGRPLPRGRRRHQPDVRRRGGAREADLAAVLPPPADGLRRPRKGHALHERVILSGVPRSGTEPKDLAPVRRWPDSERHVGAVRRPRARRGRRRRRGVAVHVRRRREALRLARGRAHAGRLPPARRRRQLRLRRALRRLGVLLRRRGPAGVDITSADAYHRNRFLWRSCLARGLPLTPAHCAGSSLSQDAPHGAEVIAIWPHRHIPTYLSQPTGWRSTPTSPPHRATSPAPSAGAGRPSCATPSAATSSRRRTSRRSSAPPAPTRTPRSCSTATTTTGSPRGPSGSSSSTATATSGSWTAA